MKPVQEPTQSEKDVAHQKKNEETVSIHENILEVSTDKAPFPFINPTTILITGPTMSGKSHFVKRLIMEKDYLFLNPPEKVLYAYSIWQDSFNEMKNVTFHQGLPERDMLERNTLLILDDVMAEASVSDQVMKVFTMDSHHKNITCIFLTQNIFPPGKYARTISLNTHYIILFATKRDKLQIQTIGRQMFPGQSAFFMESYRDSTSKPYGYLLCDLHPATDKRFQLRTNIFQDEHPLVYYPL